MPYATNQGVRIHYQMEGEGPSLVLLHGFNSDLANWYKRGYVEPLQTRLSAHPDRCPWAWRE